jgi:hypothetical protein
MTNDRRSKLPIPVEVTDFVFLASQLAPTRVVLEFHTADNPVRVFLNKPQLKRLATDATAASHKVRD